jgi:serine-type D-Ala-D-Ala carboxypeptidase/endopeptidase
MNHNLRVHDPGADQRRFGRLTDYLSPTKSVIPRAIWVALFLLSAFGGSLVFGAAPVVPAAVQTTIRQRVDYGYNPGVAIGIANASGRTFYSYGVADLATLQPVSQDTLFEIGSVTKVFTATLLAQMVASGELSFTNNIQDLLPVGVQAPTRNGINITLQHLATHSSGLPYVPPNLTYSFFDNPFADYSVALLYEHLNTFVVTRNPGSGYEYSNVGFGLLGHGLALRAGVSYEALLKARIMDPLAMPDTRIDLSQEQFSRYATGYGGVVARPAFAMDSLAPAGSLISSVNDLLTFLEFYSGLRSTTDSTLSAAFTNAVTLRRSTDIPGLSIGLGWWLLPVSGDTIIFHEGNTVGQTAFIGFRKNSKTLVVALTNARVSQFSNLEDIGLYLLNGISTLTPITRPATVSPEVLRKYQGLYTSTDGTFFDLRLTNNFLTFSYSTASNYFSTVYPQSARLFNNIDLGVNASALFVTNATGKVTSMTWTQNGATSTYTRQTNASHLEFARHNGAFELILHGDSQHDYIIEATQNFSDWQSISTNSIWTNRIPISPSIPPHQFYRTVQK